MTTDRPANIWSDVDVNLLDNITLIRIALDEYQQCRAWLKMVMTCDLDLHDYGMYPTEIYNYIFEKYGAYITKDKVKYIYAPDDKEVRSVWFAVFNREQWTAFLLDWA